ncbi:hypothetical protein ES705_48215 [subsurface metagenome]
MLGDKFNKKNIIHNLLLGICSKLWVIPAKNRIDEYEYRTQLENSSFKIIFLKKIGDKVFEGYSNSFNHECTKKQIKKLGFFKSKGMIFIGKILGYLYKKGLIEYVYVKAKKIK